MKELETLMQEHGLWSASSSVQHVDDRTTWCVCLHHYDLGCIIGDGPTYERALEYALEKKNKRIEFNQFLNKEIA